MDAGDGYRTDDVQAKLREVLRSCMRDEGVVPLPGGDGVSSGRSMFLTLFHTWSCSPVATLSLCLLAQTYEIACQLVSKLYVKSPIHTPEAPAYACDYADHVACVWLCFLVLMHQR